MTVVTMDASAERGGGLDEQLVRQPAQRARAAGLKLTREGGLLSRLTKVVVESALEVEMRALPPAGSRGRPRSPKPSTSAAGNPPPPLDFAASANNLDSVRIRTAVSA